MAGKNKKINKELSRFLLQEIGNIEKTVKEKATLEAMGDGIISEMKSMISKGISPIEGAGRFPEYKVKGRQRDAQNKIKAARLQRASTKARASSAKKISQRQKLAAKALRLAGRLTGSKKIKSVSKDYARRGKQSALKKRLLASQSRREQRGVRSLTQAKKEIRGYPYTVQKRYPGKKPRPVNLFLSGRFLSTLRKLLTSESGGTWKLEVGFTDEKSSAMEEGHRTGWLGQGKRAIIPQAGEKFAQRIQRVAEKILGQQLAKKLKAR